MRQLASYSLAAKRDPEQHPSATGDEVSHHIETWLASKGKPTEAGEHLVLNDGRLATIDRNTLSTAQGNLWEVVLTEPTPGGWLRTSIAVAESLELLAVSVGLSAGSSSLSPVSLDVHCPRVVRTLLDSPVVWTYGETRLTSSPLSLTGVAGGDAFINLAWSPSRSVPLVAISDEYGAVLHPGIVEAIARDLAGLAIVARLDPPASWRITLRKGKAWSCYSSAIRLYWPGLHAAANPYDHPLWTPIRLLEGVADTETAAGRIRTQLRRRILGQSAFAISEPPLFNKIRRAARQEEIAALQAKAAADTDYQALAEGYFAELLKAQALIDERDEEIEALRAQVSSLQLALKWKDGASDAVEPDVEAPPATVEEAVLVAMDRYDSTLIFGASVNEGMKTVAPDAGPPDKILSYLRGLSELTEARRAGPLGTTAIKWLGSRGIIASGESETVLNSAKEQQARTWDDGAGTRRPFNFHLKPSEATSPDRCVRIYFDYDEKRGKTVVAWVGKHP
jgi:hypothetical protein